MIEPEEICVNCYAKVLPYKQKCPWCGKTWWKYDGVQKQTKHIDSGIVQNEHADCKGKRGE